MNFNQESVKRSETDAEKGCQNCNHQETPSQIDPCKTCIETWNKEGKHSTGWVPVHQLDEEKDYKWNTHMKYWHIQTKHL